ncbi:protein gar2-like [Nicotiana tomentosiformis]|uniref:protein gar2-like n=1 Tax=Nicotiana tomentosiformis TaxID=4098 RepID=UPI00388C6A85
MAKTSKIVPQKEKGSSSRPSGDKAPVEPSTYDYVPSPCTLKIDFKIENPSSVRGVTKDAALRPSSGKEGTKSPVQKSRKDKKRKAASWSEDPKPKTRRQKVKKIGSLREEVDQIKAESKRIEELEARLAEAKAEVESSKILADKSIAVYRANAEAAQMEAREAANTTDTRAHWVAELAKCRSRRETLEEIHAHGFDLTEEIKKAKELKAEAESLASDGDDDDDDGSKSGSEDGEEPDREANAPELSS